eukprot:SAG11_NODE_2937_length_2824_cov_1.679633_2_plen_234_part_00
MPVGSRATGSPRQPQGCRHLRPQQVVRGSSIARHASALMRTHAGRGTAGCLLKGTQTGAQSVSSMVKLNVQPRPVTESQFVATGPMSSSTAAATDRNGHVGVGQDITPRGRAREAENTREGGEERGKRNEKGRGGGRTDRRGQTGITLWHIPMAYPYGRRADSHSCRGIGRRRRHSRRGPPSVALATSPPASCPPRLALGTTRPKAVDQARLAQSCHTRLQRKRELTKTHAVK